MFSNSWLAMILPWQFSPIVVLVFALSAWGYWRGCRSENVPLRHKLLFWFGWLLCYIVLHTRFDYFAQYMFFMHRIQHLVLHHLGAFLICLALPWNIMAKGLFGKYLSAVSVHPATRIVIWIYKLVQHPLIAVVLFVGLIYFWMDPGIHFRAMLDTRLYQLMNWSMLVDGLLFWSLILNPASALQGALVGYGKRAVMLVVIVPPQLFLGWHLTQSEVNLYDIYSICGRAWPISAMTDQYIAGLVTWVPASMMSVIALLVVVHYVLSDDQGQNTNRDSLSSLDPVPDQRPYN